MFEDDGLIALFILGLILLTSLHSWSQETCKHCPVGSQLDEQFPEAPQPKHHVFTKTFWAAEAIHASSISLDVYATASREGHDCLEGHNGFAEYESGKELALNGAIEFGAVFGVSALLRISPPKHLAWISFLPQAYGTALHAHAATQWYSRC